MTGSTIQHKVDVSSEGQSDAASITATDSNPAFAAKIANTFAEEYIAIRREADRGEAGVGSAAAAGTPYRPPAGNL